MKSHLPGWTSCLMMCDAQADLRESTLAEFLVVLKPSTSKMLAAGHCTYNVCSHRMGESSEELAEHRGSEKRNFQKCLH